LNEPAFRAELSEDPESTARRHGFDLTDEEWAALRRFDWALYDEDPTPSRRRGRETIAFLVPSSPS
jgi:hypothetical protein